MTDVKKVLDIDETKGRPSIRIAELLTLIISISIIGGLAVYLALESSKPASNEVFVEVHPKFESVAQKGSHYLLPVEITNPSRKTLSKLWLRLEEKDGSEFQILTDYVAEQSSETVYFYLDKEPRESDVRIEPMAYLLR